MDENEANGRKGAAKKCHSPSLLSAKKHLPSPSRRLGERFIRPVFASRDKVSIAWVGRQARRTKVQVMPDLPHASAEATDSFPPKCVIVCEPTKKRSECKQKEMRELR